MADVRAADVRAADVRGAALGSTIFLSQTQLDAAGGDATTQSPSWLPRPPHLVGRANIDDGGRHENDPVDGGTPHCEGLQPAFS